MDRRVRYGMWLDRQEDAFSVAYEAVRKCTKDGCNGGVNGCEHVNVLGVGVGRRWYGTRYLVMGKEKYRGKDARIRAVYMWDGTEWSEA